MTVYLQQKILESGTGSRLGLEKRGKRGEKDAGGVRGRINL